MSELLPCPFCGAGEHRFDDRTHWTGMRSILLSVTLIHWCSVTEGEGPRRTVIQVTRPTKLEAIEAWNSGDICARDAARPGGQEGGGGD